MRQNECIENHSCLTPFCSPPRLCAILLYLESRASWVTSPAPDPQSCYCSASALSTHRVWLFQQIYVSVGEVAFYRLRAVCCIPIRFLVFWDPFRGFCFCFFIYFFISVVSIRASLSNSESLALWNASPVLSNEPTATSPWDPMLPLLPPSLLFPLGTPGPCVSLIPSAGHRLCL